jgi:hypothetical protein
MSFSVYEVLLNDLWTIQHYLWHRFVLFSKTKFPSCQSINWKLRSSGKWCTVHSLLQLPTFDKNVAASASRSKEYATGSIFLPFLLDCVHTHQLTAVFISTTVWASDPILIHTHTHIYICISIIVEEIIIFLIFCFCYSDFVLNAFLNHLYKNDELWT